MNKVINEKKEISTNQNISKSGGSVFTKKNLILALAIIVTYFIIVILSEYVLNRHFNSLIVPIGINVILAVSLNLTTGFLGELSLGHAGFMAIGAYAGSIFTIYANLPSAIEFILGLLIGGIFAAFFGVIIGVPVLRLKGDYLAIVTLAFGEIIRSIINYLPITGGAMGLSKIPRYATFTWTYIIMIITIILISNFVKSRHGRAVCTIRENFLAADSIGIKVSKYKIMAFVIAAFFAGIAGVLYAHTFSSIKPVIFDYNKSIEILVIVVLGGMGSIRGSIIAAVLLTVLPELLRGTDDLRMLLYSLVLIAMMLFNSSDIRTKLEESGKLPKLPKLSKSRAK